MPQQEDSVWKEVLDSYFEPFLAFFFPAIHCDIDWSRSHEFLDKELEHIIRGAALKKRLADKLARVFLRDGEEAWLLIHVEVQGSPEADFPERVYIYNFKIFEHYHREVVSLEILTDEHSWFRPGAYEARRWGFEHVLRFPVVKLLDYRDKWTELEADPNPFAIVVMAHLEAQKSRTDDERFGAKLRLSRMLCERGYERRDIIHLFRFIDWLLELPQDLELEAHRRIVELLEGKTMPYVTHIERILGETWKAEGREEGLRQGLEQGVQQGLLQGLREGIELGLQLRFGKEALILLPRICEIHDVDRLRGLKEALARVQSLKELEALLHGP